MDNKEDSWDNGLFLDPDRKSLQDFENALITSVRLLGLWWDGTGGTGSPVPGSKEISRFCSASKEYFRSSSLVEAYKQLEPCIKTLFKNLRFNKNNMMNVHPSPLLPAIVASLFTSLQNPNNISPTTSPATTIMEKECITQLADLVGFRTKKEPRECQGNILSCGSVSNLTALMVAREKAYVNTNSSHGEPVRQTGLFGASRGLIVASSSVHYSIHKAARILGMGDRSVVEVPVASDGEIAEFEKAGTPLKLRPSEDDYAEAFEKIRKGTNRGGFPRQLIISAISNLGTINTGTIEPVRPLVGLRSEFGFHLHVDAAIGGLALGLSEIKDKASGVEHADSITMDPHKLGFLPYPCSAIIFRDQHDLEIMAIDAPYVDSCANTIEGSRPGSGIAGLWVALKTLGREGYNRIIGRCIELTKTLSNQLRETGFQVLHEVDLNTVCFSLKIDTKSRRGINKLVDGLHARIRAEGKYLLGKVEDISGVMVRDRPWQTDSEKVRVAAIKVWIMNPYTTEKDLESLVSYLDEKRKHVAST
jgi:aromatic-L-amino-acid decarboxylase